MDTVHTIRTRELDKFIIIKQVISKHITQKEAAAQLKMSDRHIRRLVLKVKAEGIQGLKPKHKGGNRFISHDLKAQIMSRVCEKYSDFGPTFAQEKLTEEGYKMSKETLRQWMIEASLWKCKKPCHILHPNV